MSEITYTVTIDAGALEKIGKDAGVFVREVAQGMITEMRLSMSKPKSGWLYRRGKTSRSVHQASAPGEAPAVDTGTLFGEMQWRSTGPLSAEVDIIPEYASYLETGTRRMAPRPYVQPAIDAITAKYSGILSSARR